MAKNKKKVKSNSNNERTVTFYEPHPLTSGQKFAFPKAVQEVAKQLNGQTISIREALKQIKKVTSAKIKLESRNYISLTVSYPKDPYDKNHTFCVIKFYEPK